MKKTLFFKFLILIVASTLYLPNTLAEEPTQWNLPKDAKARIGKGRMNAIQYSPDGKLLAVASGIGIWLYDVATRREIALLTAHTSVVDRLAFSPDGRTFASGSRDGTILLWGYRSADGSASVQTKLTVDREELSGLNLAFSPDGKTLASGTGYAIQFWDIVTGEQKSAIPSFSKFLSFSPDGATMIVCADREGTINLWNPITGKHKKMIPGDIDHVVSVALSPNGKTIAMGSYDGPIHLYDLDTSENKITLSGHKWQVRSLAFSPDGGTLVSGGWDQTIRLWDVETGEHKQTLTGHKEWVRSLALSPDGKTISSGSGDGTIHFWDADTGSFRNTITGYTGAVSITFSPDGQTLSTEYGDGTIRLWDANTGQHVETYNQFRDMISRGAVRNIIAFAPGGKTLAWDGWGDDGMRLLDVDTDEHRVILTISEWGNHSVEFSPDGNIIAISFGKGNLIKLWDVHTSEQKLTLTGHTADIFRLAFSPDSKVLASTSDDNTIRLWDTQTGENTEVFTLESAWRKDVADWRIDSSWCGVAFSPDGKTLAGGGGEIILLWDIGTGKTKMRLTMPTHRVFDLAFSPDGKVLASAGFERFINLWDPHTGDHKKTLTGHTAWVRSITFSPDGKTLASRSDDGTVLLWAVNP